MSTYPNPPRATNPFVNSLLLTLAMSFAYPVLAQDAERRQGPRPMDPLMRAIDRDGDGSLQQAEIDMAVAALRALDRNQDGTVSPDELGTGGRPGAERRPDNANPMEQGGRRGPQDFARLDANGDGKLSKAEAPERLKDRFEMFDTNGDGFLDLAEQAQLVQRMRNQQQDRERRPGMGQGGGDVSGGEAPKRPEAID